MAFGKVAQMHGTNPYTDEINDAQIDEFTHPANLSIASFGQNDAQRLCVFLCDRRRLQPPFVKLKTVTQQTERFFGYFADDLDDIFLIETTLRTDQRFGQHAIF